MSMSYVQIQNAVLADAFAEAKRADAKNWIVARHAWLWDAEQWTFRFGTSPVVFTASSQIVSGLPADFRAAVALYDSQGEPLRPIRDLREFYDSYNANLGLGAATPDAYTVVAGQLIVGPQGDGTSGLLIYEKSKPALTNDGDSTGLPDGYDLALVHGAKAEGFKLSNIPLWNGFDQDFTAAVNALRNNYLSGVRAAGAEQLGTWRPGSQWR